MNNFVHGSLKLQSPPLLPQENYHLRSIKECVAHPPVLVCVWQCPG